MHVESTLRTDEGAISSNVGYVGSSSAVSTCLHRRHAFEAIHDIDLEHSGSAGCRRPSPCKGYLLGAPDNGRPPEESHMYCGHRRSRGLSHNY